MSAPKVWRNISGYYNLIGKKCLSCKSLWFPARDVCRKCLENKMKNFTFEGFGIIKTFTVIRTPAFNPSAEGGEISTIVSPYVMAIVQLDQGPCLTSEIVDCKVDDVEIGKMVEAVFRKISQDGNKGVISYGYKFKLSGK